MAEKKKKKNKLTAFLFALGFAIAAGVLIYPSFTDALSSIKQTAVIGGYESSIYDYDEETLKKMKADAVAYNEKLYEKQKSTPFIFQGYKDNDEEYESLLKVSSLNRVMATLEIPSINVYLPVTHGTNSEDLTHMIGHMYGSSLPIGGENTHATLAGHTGLQGVDLLTHLTDLKVGDQFYIHVLNEHHVYTVDAINVTWPKEEAPFLQIEDGQDYITLYTCTPYGVNDHRLLVRGKRTFPDLIEDADGTSNSTSVYHKEAIIKTILFGLVPLLVFIIILYLSLRQKKSVNKSRLSNESERTEAKKETERQDIP